MKKLMLPILLYSFHVSAQQNLPSYAPSCADTIYLEEDRFCSTCGEHHFFGGAEQFKRFLDINLRPLLGKEKAFSDTVSLMVHIDTFGQPQNVYLLTEAKPYDTHSKAILNAVRSVSRWKPTCYYVVDQNRVICQEMDFPITIIIRNRKIFLLSLEQH